LNAHHRRLSRRISGIQRITALLCPQSSSHFFNGIRK
jgi:hypothetical protein